MSGLGSYGGDSSHGSRQAGYGGADAKGGASDVLLDQARDFLNEGQEGSGGVRSAVVKFTRDTTVASGTQAVTGIGFKPKAVIFIGNEPSTLEWSLGYDIGTARFVTTRTPTVYETSVSYSIYDTEALGATEYDGLISSFDVDGFTVTWTKVGSPTGTYEIFALCLR